MHSSQPQGAQMNSTASASAVPKSLEQVTNELANLIEDLMICGHRMFSFRERVLGNIPTNTPDKDQGIRAVPNGHMAQIAQHIEVLKQIRGSMFEQMSAIEIIG